MGKKTPAFTIGMIDKVVVGAKASALMHRMMGQECRLRYYRCMGCGENYGSVKDLDKSPEMMASEKWEVTRNRMALKHEILPSGVCIGCNGPVYERESAPASLYELHLMRMDYLTATMKETNPVFFHSMVESVYEVCLERGYFIVMPYVWRKMKIKFGDQLGKVIAMEKASSGTIIRSVAEDYGWITKTKELRQIRMRLFSRKTGVKTLSVWESHITLPDGDFSPVPLEIPDCGEFCPPGTVEPGPRRKK